jgi:16S rRNA (guanine1207-N2)-methyltransferase
MSNATACHATDAMSGGHYFDAAPEVASAESSVTLALPDLTMRLATDRGVFSRDGVDAGTRFLLLDAPSPPTTGDVLDLGCGYGPIAAVLRHRAPQTTVWAVDTNERARALCARNVPSAHVCAPEDVPTDVRFAAIWSNPPIRIGKAALHDLLTTWLARLADGGSAVLVVQRHLGADSLHRWLEGEGWRVGRLSSRQGYRLLEVRR